LSTRYGVADKLMGRNHHDSTPGKDPPPPSKFAKAFRAHLPSLLPPVIGAIIKDLHSVVNRESLLAACWDTEVVVFGVGSGKKVTV